MAKVSISIDDDVLRWLKARALRLHGGNLSVAVAEGARLLRHTEALGALLDQLGAPMPSQEESSELDAELLGRQSRRPRKRTRRAA